MSRPPSSPVLLLQAQAWGKATCSQEQSRNAAVTAPWVSAAVLLLLLLLLIVALPLLLPTGLGAPALCCTAACSPCTHVDAWSWASQTSHPAIPSTLRSSPNHPGPWHQC